MLVVAAHGYAFEQFVASQAENAKKMEPHSQLIWA